MDGIAKLLQEKLLVVPKYYEVEEGKNKGNRYIAQGVHPANEKDMLFPVDRKLHLCYPLSASNGNIKLETGHPEKIVVSDGEEELNTFKLRTVGKNKQYQELNSRDQKIVDRKVEVLNNEQEIFIPMQTTVKLPMYEENKMISRTFTYKDLIESLARDLKEDFYLMKVRDFKKNLRGKAKEEFEPSSAQLAQIATEFVDFVKGVDAFEICYTGSAPLLTYYKGFDNLDPEQPYELYTVIMYRIPDFTKAERQIKKEIMGKVKEKKQAILTQKCEKDK